MNRRHYFKSLFILGGTGLVSFSILKYINVNEHFDLNLFRSKTEILAELAELIIPKTDTPGAKEAGVHNFIMGVIINCNNAKQQRNFLSGIEEIENYAYSNFGVTFLQCTFEEKRDTLFRFSTRSIFSNKLITKINKKMFGEAFYTKLRSLVVEGYCCSQLGGTQGLAYDYIPGKYDSCIPLKSNQKSWATK